MAEQTLWIPSQPTTEVLIAEGRDTTSQRGLSRPEPNEASSPTLHKDPPLKVQITHTHTHTRLAVANALRLVTKGQLHPARVVTRCSSLVPLGGPALCGLNCRPYFACRNAMRTHIQQLAAYCERTWASKVGLNRVHILCPYTHRPRKTAQEVEEHRLHRALQGNLQSGLAPSSEQTTFARGGGGGAAPPLQLIFSP